MKRECRKRLDRLIESAADRLLLSGPVWYSGDWIKKNLVLFFDGIALLVPEYMKDKPDVVDAAIAAGLRKEHLLHILEPEKIVDKSATEKLATAMTDVIASGALDSLAKDHIRFHELLFVSEATEIPAWRKLNLRRPQVARACP